MKNKNISLLCGIALAVATSTLTADVYHGSTSSFSGVITAIETSRDSFTVESEDGTVKMFQVSPSRKSSLSEGAKVTVSYVDAYEWPLKTTSISGGSYMK